MDRMEYAKWLRTDQGRHHNCCQTVLMTFADKLNMDPEEAYRLGTFMGSGMRCGATCGVLTSACLVLGAAGAPAEAQRAVIQEFRQQHGTLTCVDLLTDAKARGEEKKPFCDGLVLDMVARLAQLLDAAAPKASQP